MLNYKNDDFNPSSYNHDTIVAEFSGRDSVAAILKAFQNEEVTYILPVMTFAGTEYGDPNTLVKNYEKLKAYVEKTYPTKVLYDVIHYSLPEVWHIINGRFISESINRYGFYNPCIGCHLYFHGTKVFFSKYFKNIIITGERESHDGSVKVNQLKVTLDAYKDIFKAYDISLWSPLAEISSGQAIQDLIPWPWDEGQDHPSCVLSGNYRDIDGKAIYEVIQLEKYLEDYIKPVGRGLVQLNQGEINLLDFKKIVGGCL
jgi:hypothetical protein